MQFPTGGQRVRLVTKREQMRSKPDEGTYRALPRLPLVIAAELRRDENFGTIARVAESLRAEKLLVSGLAITGTGHCGALTWCPWDRVDALAPNLVEYASLGYRLYAVDLIEGARPFGEVDWVFPCVLVLGSESSGISPATLEVCHEAVYVPSYGMNSSMNVAVCAALVGYEAIQHLSPRPQELGGISPGSSGGVFGSDRG